MFFPPEQKAPLGISKLASAERKNRNLGSQDKEQRLGWWALLLWSSLQKLQVMKWDWEGTEWEKEGGGEGGCCCLRFMWSSKLTSQTQMQTCRRRESWHLAGVTSRSLYRSLPLPFFPQPVETLSNSWLAVLWVLIQSWSWTLFTQRQGKKIGQEPSCLQIPLQNASLLLLPGLCVVYSV